MPVKISVLSKKLSQPVFVKPKSGLFAVWHILIIILFTLYAGFTILNTQKTVTPLTDEISWFFHTEFFEHTFILRDYNQQFWQSYESYDYPQVSKYIFGGYLYLHQRNIFQIRNRLVNTWGRWQFYFDPRLRNIRNTEFYPYIMTMREVNSFFTLLALLCIYGITLMLTGSCWCPLASGLLLLANRTFMEVMLRATPEGHFMAFMFLAVLLYMIFERTKKIYWLICCSLLAGLAVSSKLTAIIFPYTVLIFEISRMIMNNKIQKTAIKILIIFSGITIYIWFISNPAVYPNPILNSWKFIDFRIKQEIRNQMFSSDALYSLPQRVQAVYCSVLSTRCGYKFPQGYLFPITIVNLIFFLTGIFYLCRDSFINRKSYRVFFVIFIILTVTAITFYLPTNTVQYYVPVMVIVYMISVIGIWYILSKLRNTVSKFRIN
jgi:hypothetical protein